MAEGFVYIMTNPSFPEMVKIGYATDVETRRKQLSGPAVPFPYKVYATYETTGNLEDKKLHKMIEQLNPDLRVNKKREFFELTAEEAFQLFEAIATITNTRKKLKRWDNTKENSEKRFSREQKNILRWKTKASSYSNKQSKRKSRPRIDFKECGLREGAFLTFKDDPSVKVKVVDRHQVEYKGKIRTLTSIARELKGVENIQGPAYFTHKGELITDIAERTQWKNESGSIADRKYPLSSKTKTSSHDSKQSERKSRPRIDFKECGLRKGALLVFKDDPSTKVNVVDRHQVEYKGIIRTLTSIAGELKGVKDIQGSAYFTYKGELITDIAERTQWKNKS